jgi:hypothetical protein
MVIPLIFVYILFSDYKKTSPLIISEAEVRGSTLLDIIKCPLFAYIAANRPALLTSGRKLPGAL